MPFQKILVALDKTSLADHVFDHALTLAQQDRSQLLMVHCLSPNSSEHLGMLVDSGAGLHSQSDLRRVAEADRLEQIEAIQPWLKNLQATAHERGVEAKFTYGTAGPGPTICQLAEDQQADVIVIGSGGKQGLKKLILGSVSDYVIHHAPCPAIVVTADSSSTRTYLPGGKPA